MSIKNQITENDDILDIYKNFKGHDDKLIIDDLEPGVVYGFKTVNHRVIRRITAENAALKRKYFWSSILNIILLITIITVSLFAGSKFNELNNDYIALSEKCNELNTQIVADSLVAKVHFVTEQIENVATNGEVATDKVVTEQVPEVVIKQEEIIKDEVTAVAVKEKEVNEAKVLEKYASIPLDDNLKMYIYNKAKENNIPPEILFSIAWKESNYSSNAKSSTNDHGLFQINECNFKNLAKRFGWTLEKFWNKIYDPYVNTDCAVYILISCRDNYKNNNWHHVLMRYNLGPGGANKFFADGVYSTKYSRATLEYADKTFGFTNIKL